MFMFGTKVILVIKVNFLSLTKVGFKKIYVNILHILLKVVNCLYDKIKQNINFFE